MIQHATKLIYSYRYSKLIRYYTTIDTTISRNYTMLIQQSMHSIPSYYNNNATSYDVHPPAAGGPPPMRIPRAARRTLNQLTKTMNYVLLYCFFLFLPFVLLISTRRPISREDAHRMYPRYLCVFFFFCHDLLPTPPPISVRKAGGITVVYLCGF